MDDKKLQALIRKNMAKAEKAKPKPRKAYDATLDATRPPESEEEDAAEALDMFREMKRREF